MSEGNVTITHTADSSQMRAEYQKTLAAQDKVIQKLREGVQESKRAKQEEIRAERVKTIESLTLAREEVEAAKKAGIEKAFLARATAQKEVLEAKRSLNERKEEMKKEAAAEIQTARMKMIAKIQLAKQENQKIREEARKASQDAVAAERKAAADRLIHQRKLHREQVNSLRESRTESNKLKQSTEAVGQAFLQFSAGIVSGGGIVGAINTLVSGLDRIDQHKVSLNQQIQDNIPWIKRYASVQDPKTQASERVKIEAFAAKSGVGLADALEVYQSTKSIVGGSFQQNLAASGSLYEGMRMGMQRDALIELAGAVAFKGRPVWMAPYLAKRAGDASNRSPEEMVRMGKSFGMWNNIEFAAAAAPTMAMLKGSESMPSYLENAGWALNSPEFSQKWQKIGLRSSASEIEKVQRLSQVGYSSPESIQKFLGTQDREKLIGLSTIVKDSQKILGLYQTWMSGANPVYVKNFNELVAMNDQKIKNAEAQVKSEANWANEQQEGKYGVRTQTEMTARKLQAQHLGRSFGANTLEFLVGSEAAETGNAGLYGRYILGAGGSPEIRRAELQSKLVGGTANRDELVEAANFKMDAIRARGKARGLSVEGGLVGAATRSGLRAEYAEQVTKYDRGKDVVPADKLILMNRELDQFAEKLGLASKTLADLADSDSGRLQQDSNSMTRNRNLYQTGRNGAGIE